MKTPEESNGFQIHKANGSFFTSCNDPVQAAVLVMTLGYGASIHLSFPAKEVIWVESPENSCRSDGNLTRLIEFLTQYRNEGEGRQDTEAPRLPLLD